MLRTKGIGATVRNSIEDLAGWASMERPDLARLAADGFMLAFGDPKGALRCCLDIHRELAGHPDRWQDIKVRMGIHMGPSVRRGDDLFGLNVAMAARIAGHADGGEILVSDVVRDAVGRADGIFVTAPEVVEFKGFTGTYEVFPIALEA